MDTFVHFCVLSTFMSSMLGYWINLESVPTCDGVDTLEACLQIETSYRQFPLYLLLLHSSLESVFGGPHAITETFLQ